MLWKSILFVRRTACPAWKGVEHIQTFLRGRGQIEENGLILCKAGE